MDYVIHCVIHRVTHRVIHRVIHRWIMLGSILFFALSVALSPSQIAIARSTITTITPPLLPPTDRQVQKQQVNGWTNGSGGTMQALLAARMATLTGLVDRSDLILRARIMKVQSSWQPQQRLIESTVIIQVAYTLLGNADHTLTLQTPGGYLPAEGIGMVSMHAADFIAGEEVLLFLHQVKEDWQTVEGAAGKFLIQGDQAVTLDGALVESVDSLLATVATLCESRGNIQPATAFWRHTTPTLAPMPLLATQPQTERKWPTPHATATFMINLNSSRIDERKVGGSSNDFRNAIIAAANQWSGLPNVDFALRYGGPATATTTSYNGVNELLFMHKGPKERAAAAEVWYRADQTIVEADIWINDDYLWDTTGSPAANEVDLQSALVHEFGHWLILAHTAQAESVMFPRLTAGTVKRQLQGVDIAGINAIYPR